MLEQVTTSCIKQWTLSSSKQNASLTTDETDSLELKTFAHLLLQVRYFIQQILQLQMMLINLPFRLQITEPLQFYKLTNEKLRKITAGAQLLHYHNRFMAPELCPGLPG